MPPYQVDADAPNATWQYPIEPPHNSPGLQMNFIDTFVPSWNSNVGSTWLYIWCAVNRATDTAGR